MARPIRIDVCVSALAHNAQQIKAHAPDKKIMGMVKANAYGCGLKKVVPALEHYVDMFGVSCMEEALIVRQHSQNDCVLCEGVFSKEELQEAANLRLDCVVHHRLQLDWLLSTPLAHPIRVWVKVNTGMNRLGFMPEEVHAILLALADCPWVKPTIGLMTHLASADNLANEQNSRQMEVFKAISLPNLSLIRSVSNSAALILEIATTEEDVVRPGLLLYGISPFAELDGSAYHLKPVMRFYSAIIALQTCMPSERVGYGGEWESQGISHIGIVAVGYGDGYPRHIKPGTSVWINGRFAPIVGRVSMDMLTIDVTHCPDVGIGDVVELWGENLPVEVIARAAGTVAYELICQVTPRAHGVTHKISENEEYYEKI